MPIKSVMLSNHLVLFHHLLLLSSIFPSIRVFSKLIGKYWSFSQNIGVSASALVLPMNIQGWFPLGLTGLISLLSKDSQESAPAPQFESISSLTRSFLYDPTLTFVQDYWKNHSFHYMDLCWQSDASAFQFVVSLCHSFPSKEQASFNFMVSVTVHSDFGAQENKSCHIPTFCLSIFHEVVGLGVVILVFWVLSFKSAFSLSSFILIIRLFSSSSLSAIKVVLSVYLKLLIFLPAILIPACDSSSLAFHMM